MGSKFLRFPIALLFLGPVLLAQEETAPPDLRAVAQAERNFARSCLEHGIRDSFLQFFADDSIIFGPAPTNGKAFYTKYQDKGRRLIWQPIFASVSKSGDLGVTTGPWELQQSATDATSLAFGQFLSVWQKQSDGSWKVRVDVGIDHPKPNEPAPAIQLLPRNDQPKPGHQSAQAQAEKTFGETLRRDAGRAVLDSAGPDIRCLRENSYPAVGKSAAKTMLDSDHGKETRQKAGGGQSKSGDLAYEYGSYASEPVETGYYLTIWRTERTGDWKILIDLQKKADAK